VGKPNRWSCAMTFPNGRITTCSHLSQRINSLEGVALCLHLGLFSKIETSLCVPGCSYLHGIFRNLVELARTRTANCLPALVAWTQETVVVAMLLSSGRLIIAALSEKHSKSKALELT